MRLRLFVMLCVTLLVAGCFGMPSSRETGGDSYVKLTINWDSLDADPLVRPQPQSVSTMALADQVSVIGARVVAPDINALLAQSATRQAAETQGIITIPVPATNNANLYAVAVDDHGTPLMLGYLNGISIAESTVLTITTDELTWITPDAYFTGEVTWETPAGTFSETIDVARLEQGAITAPNEVSVQGCDDTVECSVMIHVNVTDPFGSSPVHPMICMSGFHVSTPCDQQIPNSNGWANVYLYCATEHAEPCSARAYVNGASFLLSPTYAYFGPQFGPFTIDWTP